MVQPERDLVAKFLAVSNGNQLRLREPRGNVLKAISELTRWIGASRARPRDGQESRRL